VGRPCWLLVGPGGQGARLCGTLWQLNPPTQPIISVAPTTTTYATATTTATTTTATGMDSMLHLLELQRVCALRGFVVGCAGLDAFGSCGGCARLLACGGARARTRPCCSCCCCCCRSNSSPSPCCWCWHCCCSCGCVCLNAVRFCCCWTAPPSLLCGCSCESRGVACSTALPLCASHVFGKVACLCAHKAHCTALAAGRQARHCRGTRSVVVEYGLACCCCCCWCSCS